MSESVQIVPYQPVIAINWQLLKKVLVTSYCLAGLNSRKIGPAYLQAD